MRTVTYKLADLSRVVIHLGKMAENDATQVRIDAAEVFNDYPNAVPAMDVINPTGEAYTVEVTRDGSFVVWDVKDSSLTAEGQGEIQLTFTQDGTKVKSSIGRTQICRSITGGGTPPDPVQDWLDHANEVLAEVEDAIPEGGTTGQVLAKKSDEDYDLEWIDQGAGGTTDYTDLENKPQIGGVTLTGDVSLHDIGAAAESDIPDVSGFYTKPAGGIPASDIAAGVIPDPAALIDDTSTAANKVWSASKSNELKSALSFVKGDGNHSAVVEGEYYGYINDADADFSVAHGVGSSALGIMSHAEGLRTIAIGQGAHSEGSASCAFGNYSHAEGDGTLSIGSNSHAEGSGAKKDISITGAENATTYNVTSGSAKVEDVGYIIVCKKQYKTISAVDTVDNTITVNSSFGEALSDASCVVYYGYSMGNDSHTEGFGTSAKGFAAHAEGAFNVPGSKYPTWAANTSYSVGDRVIRSGSGYVCIEANTDSSWTAGKWAFCYLDYDYVHTVGNGYSSVNRSNAFAVDVYGNGHFNGDVYVGCDPDSTGGTKLPKDVQVNGVSVVVNGVANIPLNPVQNVTGATPTITGQSGVRYICGEVSTLSITAPASGIIDVIFESGSTPTVLTVSSSIKWANGFDPTLLEANTTYELNIMDGTLGVAGSWT